MSAAPDQVGQIIYTVFPDRFAQKKYELAETWPEIVARLKAPTIASEKLKLPLLSFGLYGSLRTKKKALRHAENLRAVTGVEGDYDQQQMPMEDAAERMALAGIRCAFYTTSTHAPDKPKWRIIAPLSREYPPADRARFLARINGILGGPLTSESFTPSQSFYFGRVEGVEYEVIEVEGDYIDLRDEFDQVAIYPKGKSADDKGASDATTDDGHREAIRTGSNLHESLRALAARLVGRGMAPDDVIATLEGLMQESTEAGTDRWRSRYAEIPRLVESAAAKFRDPRKVIELDHAAPPDDQFPPMDVIAEGDAPEGGQPVHQDDDYRRLRFRPLHELLATPTHVEWLLRGILERRVITLVAGKRGSFKSFVLLHWLLTLAVRGVPVFLVSAEGAGLSRRIEAWLKVHAPDADQTKITLFVHEQRVNFNDPAGLSAVRAAIEASGMAPEVVAIDTFSKNSGGLDENSNSEVKAFIGGLDAGLRIPLDTSVILVAHTGHGDQTRVRGASALEADTDAALIVNRPGVERVVTVERNRFKDAPELPPLVYNAEEVDLERFDDDGQRVTSLVMREADDQTRHAVVSKAPIGKAQREILRALRNRQAEANGPLIWSLEDMRKIGRDLGQHKSTARGAVDGLVCNGFLTPTVGGHRLADGAA